MNNEVSIFPITMLILRARSLRGGIEKCHGLAERCLSVRRQVKVLPQKTKPKKQKPIKVNSDYALHVSRMVRKYVDQRSTQEQFSIGDLCLNLVSNGFTIDCALDTFTELVASELTNIEKENCLKTSEDENRGLLYRRIK